MDKHTKYRQSEKGKLTRTEYQREYMRRYRQLRKRPSGSDPYSKKYHHNLRLRVLEILGGAFCAECGCDELAILEINHKSGGGNKIAKDRPLRMQHLDIVLGRVDLSEYNVLCRVCNAAHYVRELLGIDGHRVIWNKVAEQGEVA